MLEWQPEFNVGYDSSNQEFSSGFEGIPHGTALGEVYNVPVGLNDYYSRVLDSIIIYTGGIIPEFERHDWSMEGF